MLNLSKNLFFSFERNWIRKIKELLIALQIEASFSKREILEAYSNQIYFGNGAYGVEEASQLYFAKPARSLTVFEGALLAGIPHSPNQGNPFVNLDRAKKRARYVMDRMVDSGFLTLENRQKAIESDIAIIFPKKKEIGKRKWGKEILLSLIPKVLSLKLLFKYVSLYSEKYFCTVVTSENNFEKFVRNPH